jgi:hypothetical protein
MEANNNTMIVTLTIEQLHDLIRESVREELQDIRPAKEETTKLLTRLEACKALHVSLPTLSRYMDLGIVKGQKVGNRILIPHENIKNALTDIPTRKHNK